MNEAQQKQLTELFDKLFALFAQYKTTSPEIDKLRQQITDLDAQLQQFGTTLATSKTSQLEHTNQLIRAITLNQEIQTIIQKDIATITKLKEAEENAALANKNDKLEPKGPSLAEEAEKRLQALIELQQAAQSQEAELRERLEKLLKDAEEDLDEKYDKAVSAKQDLDTSQDNLTAAYKQEADAEITVEDLVVQREANIAAFKDYSDQKKNSIQEQIAETPVINLDNIVASSEIKLDKASKEAINSARTAHILAQGSFVAQGVDSKFFNMSRADFVAQLEEERQGKPLELDDTIDSVLQGAAGPLTFAQFNASKDGLETSIAAVIDPVLAPISSDAAKKIVDAHVNDTTVKSIITEVHAAASENAVSTQQMADAQSKLNQAQRETKEAEGSHADAANKFKNAASDIQQALTVVEQMRQQVNQAKKKDDAAPEQPVKNTPNAKDMASVVKKAALLDVAQLRADAAKTAKEAAKAEAEAKRQAAEAKRKADEAKKLEEEARDRSRKPGLGHP